MFGKKKYKVEEFAAALRMIYSDMVQENLKYFLGLDELWPSGKPDKLQWPKLVEQEVACLLYFAFDFGMASGREENLRGRIRDAFLKSSPPPSEVAELLANRSEEYKRAMMTGDPVQQKLHLGNVFAYHIGHDKDVLVATLAVSHFAAAYKLVTQQVNERIVDLQ